MQQLIFDGAVRRWTEQSQFDQITSFLDTSPVAKNFPLDKILQQVGAVATVNNPQAALNVFVKIEDPNARDVALERAAAELSESDPAMALRFTFRISGSESRTDRINSIMGRWEKLDSSAAAAFRQSPEFAQNLRKP
jgi:hypothetical protein